MPPAGYTATNLPAIDKAAQRRYVGIKRKFQLTYHNAG